MDRWSCRRRCARSWTDARSSRRNRRGGHPSDRFLRARWVTRCVDDVERWRDDSGTNLARPIAMMSRPGQIALVVMSLLTLRPSVASATLGEDVATVTTDRVRGAGALRAITKMGSYTVHEMQMASGTVV